MAGGRFCCAPTRCTTQLTDTFKLFRVPIQPLFSFHLAVDVGLAYIYDRQMRPLCCLPRLKIAVSAVTAAGLI